ncbi:MAG TPA: hypothetical protein VK450_01115 [Methanomicrobiales archaeon]|nr:hypothetical protein [Methanomicrobiales archaeon]
MRPFPVVLALLLLAAGLALPVSAAEANRADTNRVGYVSIEGVSISLHGSEARIGVDYTIDPGMHLIFLLFGTGDLQRKIEKALNYPSLKAGELGSGHAVFTLEGAADCSPDGACWFTAHRFGATIPRVEITAPGYSLSYTRAGSIPKGFGYFDTS